ncbi:MAG: aconitase/3-isopropylmalate dehydratase large subunit family protein [bacterium]|jgi:homoaconitate hydratase family protein/3-isopropylmalate dehydratase small subunit|nr:aconitase/3-isopropylmalate dehydratase large subunit family protein [candidate division KSB1 bacterium]MDH7560783.1 aconitase/3-isopropylmalate dehydratase large subunit family protein [bacterium]
MGQTIIEKIISAHADRQARAGEIVWMDIDLRSARDFGGANVVKNLREHYQGNYVADPSRTVFTFDCNVPANTAGYADNQQICRLFAREQGIRVYDVNQGIGSHVVIEQGLVVPGEVMVGTDSHLNILGAIGAFGQGMGDQDIAFAFKTGRTWFEVPATIRVNLYGTFHYPTTAKDLTLYIVGKLGTKGALGKAVELYGPAIDQLSLAGRITLASMATEMGAIAAFMVPNEEVLSYCRARSGRAVSPVTADSDAEYVRVIDIDVSHLRPQVARPNSPADVVPASELGGVRIDSVFIGSCTNGRYEDYAVVASILRGRGVAEGVMLKIVPATAEVYDRLLDDGLIKIFREAGAVVSHPGCGGCASGQIGMVGEHEVQISTSNRNFRGKQGKGDTYLASPATAAASALRGFITCPTTVAHTLIDFVPDGQCLVRRSEATPSAAVRPSRPAQAEVFSPTPSTPAGGAELIVGRVFKIVDERGDLIDDIDTDMIFHNRYLHIRDVAQMGQYTFDNLRGYEDFGRRATPQDIVVVGKNFGCGSSRQQGVDCFRTLGIKLIISESTGAIYKRNAINSGLGLLECPGLGDAPLNHGDEIEVDVASGRIVNRTNGATINAVPFSSVQLEIYRAGNLFAYGTQLMGE